jgi:hypothetical protein
MIPVNPLPTPSSRQSPSTIKNLRGNGAPGCESEPGPIFLFFDADRKSCVENCVSNYIAEILLAPIDPLPQSAVNPQSPMGIPNQQSAVGN